MGTEKNLLPATLMTRVAQAPVRLYRLLLSPWLGTACRFHPTCSAYAMEALEQHGALRGMWLTVKRLLRCHPFGPSGLDPVPERITTQAAETTTP